MKAALSPVIRLITAGALLLMGSACTTDGSRETTAASAPAARTLPTEPQLVAEERGERESVIKSVDRIRRTVTLRTPQGETKTVPVPPNIDIVHIQQGDTLVISVHQSLSARVLPPGSAALGATVKADAPKQEDGGSSVQRLVLVSEITANTATLQGADRQPRTIEVKNAEMQDRLHSLQAGDLLELTFTKVFAARVRRGQ